MARRGLWYVVAVSLVLMALAAGVTSQLLPLAERHPDRIADWLSARAGRPVAFDRVETAWTRRGPLLRLEGLRIGEGGEAIPVGQAEILVSQYAGLLPGRSFTELRLRGLELTLVRAADGRWSVRGLPGEQAGVDPLAALEGLGELQLVDARLGIDAPSLGLRARVPDIDLRLQVDAAQLRAGARARMRPKDAPLRASFVLDRESGDGRFYAAADDAALGGWSDLLRAYGVAVVAGHGDVEVWAALDNRQVKQVTAEVDLEELRLRGAPLQEHAGAGLPQVDFAAVQARMFWRGQAEGWRLDAERLRVQARPGDPAQRLDGLLLAGGRRYGLSAERIDAAPLIAVAALSDRLPPGLRRWLFASRPRAVLERIEVAGLRGPAPTPPAAAPSVTPSAATSATSSGAAASSRPDAGAAAGSLTDADPAARSATADIDADASAGGPAGLSADRDSDRDADRIPGPGGVLRVGADLREIGFASVGGTPGVTGLGGHLSGDGNAFVFAFDPQSRARVDWPTGFRVPHPLRLGGDVVARREGQGWRVETPALRIDGEGYGADARGGLWFEGDGTRPQVDVAVTLDDARAVEAERFWVKSTMSPSLIAWLDTAVDAGWVRGGRGVLRGDLDDWPFIARDGAPPPGVFDARATLEDMRVRFHSEWPDASDMDARIAFVDNGFEVAGSALLGEVRIGEFVAGIDNFRDGDLRIDARGDDDAKRMLGLLRQSPLQRDYGKAMATLQAEGPASAVVALRLNLDSDDPARKRVAGEMQLRGVRLAESEWKLAFSGVSGLVRYDQDGFTADGLRAQYDRQQGRLSLRAGAGHVRDPAQGFEAELEAAMSAEDLLARVPELAWLRPQVSGRSRWTAAIGIPAARPAANGGEAGPSRLTLRSDLVGTALALPAPMRKPAAQALPTTIELALPLERGEIALGFGQRLALRARQSAGGLGMRAAFGQSQVAEAPPATGLVLTGRTPVLEAIDWVALLRGGESSGGLALRRADVRADNLRMLGAGFPDTRLQLEPAAAGLSARFDGPALAGNLQIPDAAGAEIVGRLQRLHWRPDGPARPMAAPMPTLAGIPAAGGASVRAEPGAEPEGQPGPAADALIDPSRVPPLTLDIDDLRVLGAGLGQASFRSRPAGAGMDAGMEIRRLQTRAKGRRLDLTGRWTGGAAGRTALDATLVSEDFGALLSELGAGGMVAEGRGTATFQAAWPGSPMQFQLPALEGQLRLDMKDGRLAEVEPGGTGRVLGLLSLAQLPRRLLLDFRDFFSKGFAFNKLDGTVRFADGVARSDDFDIDGPAAGIAIRGSADLRAQTFDQTIEVRPKAGNLLTAVGAIAGGPVGAAVGAVANAVLQKPIGEMAAKNYRVTGPWKDPKVDVIERAQPASRGSPARAEPPRARAPREAPRASG